MKKPQLEEVRFAPNDILVMHSPHTDDDVMVSYRGPASDKQAVVWTGISQIAVPVDWLRRPTAK